MQFKEIFCAYGVKTGILTLWASCQKFRTCLSWSDAVITISFMSVFCKQLPTNPQSV